MSSKLMQEVRVAASQAPRVYFAPLVGAVKEMQRQVQLLSSARGHTDNTNGDSKKVRAVRHG